MVTPCLTPHEHTRTSDLYSVAVKECLNVSFLSVVLSYLCSASSTVMGLSTAWVSCCFGMKTEVENGGVSLHDF